VYLHVTSDALQGAAKKAGHTVQCLILLVESIINTEAVQSWAQNLQTSGWR